MAVSFLRQPIRASTYRGLSITVGVLGAAAGVVTAFFWIWGLLAVPIIVWMVLGLPIRNWYPEPAIDKWDELPKEARLELVRRHQHILFVNGQVVNLGLKDRDPEVQEAARERDREARKWEREARRRSRD